MLKGWHCSCETPFLYRNYIFKTWAWIILNFKLELGHLELTLPEIVFIEITSRSFALEYRVCKPNLRRFSQRSTSMWQVILIKRILIKNEYDGRVVTNFLRREHTYPVCEKTKKLENFYVKLSFIHLGIIVSLYCIEMFQLPGNVYLTRNVSKMIIQ